MKGCKIDKVTNGDYTIGEERKKIGYQVNGKKTNENYDWKKNSLWIWKQKKRREKSDGKEEKGRKAGVCVKLEGIITMQIHCHLPPLWKHGREKMKEEMESWRGGFSKRRRGQRSEEGEVDVLTTRKNGKERLTKMSTRKMKRWSWN